MSTAGITPTTDIHGIRRERNGKMPWHPIAIRSPTIPIRAAWRTLPNFAVFILPAIPSRTGGGRL